MKKVYEKPNAEVLAFRLVDTVALDTSYGEGILPSSVDPDTNGTTKVNEDGTNNY